MILAACGGFNGSPDNPNDDPSPYVYGRARHWSVKDASSGAVLASGCNHNPIPILRGSTPGTIVYEVSDQIVQKNGVSSERDWWCLDTEFVSSRPADTVENPACWDLPSEGPILVNDWQIIPAERRTRTLSPEEVEGRGFRMQLAVSGSGTLELEPATGCNVSARAVLRVME
jgi:hypothetical protein